jgi:hypothetical protein
MHTNAKTDDFQDADIVAVFLRMDDQNLGGLGLDPGQSTLYQSVGLSVPRTKAGETGLSGLFSRGFHGDSRIMEAGLRQNPSYGTF